MATCRSRRKRLLLRCGWGKSDLILRMRERRRRPAPAKAGGNVSIPQETFIAAFQMGEE